MQTQIGLINILLICSVKKFKKIRPWERVHVTRYCTKRFTNLNNVRLRTWRHCNIFCNAR